MFYTLTEEEIRQGKVTDIYFVRTKQILDAKKIKRRVAAEVFLKGFPRNWEWGVFCGLEEVLDLLSTHDVAIRALPEGSIFYPGEPVLEIEGEYTDFGLHETAILGFLCQATGIATMAARCRVAAGHRPLLSFGARRMHPAIAPMIDRAAYVGGCDGVSSVASAELLELPPTGTMPHALILMIGDTVEAATSFNEIIDKAVNRIVLIDTFNDEKFEAVRVAEALGKDLFGVRLDTPGSRRGNFKEILAEVRWELNLRGFSHVKLLASGGLDEYSIKELNPLCDSYGVGTSISSATTVDFSFDIIDIEGKPFAKRGKKSGRKDLYRCDKCARHIVVPRGEKAKCECGGKTTPLLKEYRPKDALKGYPKAGEIRKFVLEQLKRFGEGDIR
jgi:nicotinate phosphoribosyltransferase